MRLIILIKRTGDGMFKKRMGNWRKALAALSIVGLLGGVLAGCSSEKASGSNNGQAASSDNTIVIGSKNFTESIVLGEMMAQLVEAKTDIKVKRKLNLGGTFVNFKALQSGDIDLYPGYTGTGLTAILKKEVMKDPDKIYDLVQKEYNEKFQLKWLKPYGFNNTYVLAVKQEDAAKYNINSISDLAKVSDKFTFGAEQEFFNRDDGLPGLKKDYGLNFDGTVKMDSGLKYQAMESGKINITDAFSTDGKLVTYKLKSLEDDKGFFPPYYGAPVVRMDTLKKNPKLEETLNLLAGKITEDKMQNMNYLVEEKGQSVEQVAKDFLKENGLVTE